MQRYAIIDTASNVVLNVLEYTDAPNNPPPGFDAGVIAVSDDHASPGWKWNGTATFDPNPPPVVQLVPQSISDWQFFKQLAVDGIITQDQALASNAAVIPPPLLALVNQLPADAQFDAKMKISGATTFYRNDPLTIGIGGAYGWSVAQLDAFFTAAAAL